MRDYECEEDYLQDVGGPEYPDDYHEEIDIPQDDKCCPNCGFHTRFTVERAGGHADDDYPGTIYFLGIKLEKSMFCPACGTLQKKRKEVEDMTEMTPQQLYDLEIRKKNDERQEKILKEKELCSIILSKVNAIITDENRIHSQQVQDIVKSLNNLIDRPNQSEIEALQKEEEKLSNRRHEIQTKIQELKMADTTHMQTLIPEDMENQIVVQYEKYHSNGATPYCTIRDYGPQTALIELSKHLECYKDNEAIAAIIKSAIDLMSADTELKAFMTQ